jgi:predicted RNA-binding protein with TRAM domain
MEPRANYIAVGLFTLIAIVAAFVFVYWTAGGVDRGETVTLRVRIPGSASGLGRGSAVLFNGVRVGDVRRVYIDVTNPEVAIAETRVDKLTPITRSTRADIGIAGLSVVADSLSAIRHARVEVVRDENGVPHIFADTAEDLFRAQGYVHAQDRFWEMDFRRHVTAGRLSELFGPDQVGTDANCRHRRVGQPRAPFSGDPVTRNKIRLQLACVFGKVRATADRRHSAAERKGDGEKPVDVDAERSCHFAIIDSRAYLRTHARALETKP